jgi:hypothetical protein
MMQISSDIDFVAAAKMDLTSTVGRLFHHRLAHSAS